MSFVDGPDEFRSPLARDARALIARVVDVMTEVRVQRQRSLDTLIRARERIEWSETLIGRSTAIRARLRDSIAALTAAERAKGSPPEKVLVLLKGLVIDAERARLKVSEARLLMDEIVRWGIEAYYAA